MKKSIGTITRRYLIAVRVAGECLNAEQPNNLPDRNEIFQLATALLVQDLANPILPTDVGPVSDHGGADNQQESLLERAYRD